MSIQALVWVIEQSEARLAARCVLLSIANHCDRLGENAWPSVATIAHESRCSESSVHEAIRTLQATNELKVDANMGPQGANLYSLPGVRSGMKIIDSTPPDSAPSPSSTGAKSAPGGVQNLDRGGAEYRSKGGAESAPKPSLKKTVLNRPKNASPPAAAKAASSGGFALPPATPTFADFYKAYPRKCARKDAERAWNKLSVEDRRMAFANLDRKKRCDPNWIPNRTGRTAIEYPATYLNGARWTDEFSDIPRPKTVKEALAEMQAENLAAEALKAQQGEQHEEETGRPTAGNDVEPGQDIATRNPWQVSRHLGQGQGNGHDRSKINH
jgi:Helix-turn-helix domain